MYGLLLEAIFDCLRAKYGEEMLARIRKKAGVKEVSYDTHKVYSEAIIPRILQSTCRMTGSSTEQAMDIFGTQFVTYVGKYGYDLMLKVLGRNMSDFLNGLDNLHEYLRFSYPKLKPPSFYCENEGEGGLTLNYRSRRRGFLYYVMGQIKQVGLAFYNTNVEIEVLSLSEMKGKTHVIMQLHFNNTAFKRSIPKQLQTRSNNFSVSPDFFFRTFPFHIVFDRKMKIKSVGSSLRAILPKLLGDNVDDVFTLSRPMIEFNFNSILMHTNVMFELTSQMEVGRKPGKGSTSEASRAERPANKKFLRTRKTTAFFGDPDDDPFAPKQKGPPSEKGSSGADSGPSDMESEDGDDIQRLRLRGPMRHMPTWDCFIFLSTPVMENLDRMFDLGIFINDLSMHDASRDMVLVGTQQSKELKQALNQERQKGKKLGDAMKRLDELIQRGDELLYQMIPKVVAERLRQGTEAVDTCDSFDNVTILFSDVPSFVDISSKVQPMEIVTLLNSMYSSYDSLTDKHKVYKVETINDAYMVASGAPTPSEKHASMAADLALDMLEVVKDIPDPSNKDSHVKTRIGMHCGSVVTGVVGMKMPRYCFFGDTVNTASRMESTGGPMGIHVSEGIKKALQGYPYILEPRGTVTVKGKGEMKTYWLKGKGDSAVLPVPQMNPEQDLQFSARPKSQSPTPASRKPPSRSPSPKPQPSQAQTKSSLPASNGTKQVTSRATSPMPPKASLMSPVEPRPPSPSPGIQPAATPKRPTDTNPPSSGTAPGGSASMKPPQNVPKPEAPKPKPVASPAPQPAEAKLPVKTVQDPPPNTDDSNTSLTTNGSNGLPAVQNNVNNVKKINNVPDEKPQTPVPAEKTIDATKVEKLERSKSRLCIVL